MVWTMFIFSVNTAKVLLWHPFCPACHFLFCWLGLRLACLPSQTVSFLKPSSPMVYFPACGFLSSRWGVLLIKQKTNFCWRDGANLVWNECDFIVTVEYSQPSWLTQARACTRVCFSTWCGSMFWRNIILGYDCVWLASNLIIHPYTFQLTVERV